MKKLIVALSVGAFALSACSSDKQPETNVIVVKQASAPVKKHKKHHHKKAASSAVNCQ